MPRKPKVAMGQTEIPVPPAPRAVAEFSDEDEYLAYQEAMGSDAARRQYEEWRRLHACNCGGRSTHAIGCPKAK